VISLILGMSEAYFPDIRILCFYSSNWKRDSKNLCVRAVHCQNLAVIQTIQEHKICKCCNEGSITCRSAFMTSNKLSTTNMFLQNRQSEIQNSSFLMFLAVHMRRKTDYFASQRDFFIMIMCLTTYHFKKTKSNIETSTMFT
jgi:hypothetical protein